MARVEEKETCAEVKRFVTLVRSSLFAHTLFPPQLFHNKMANPVCFFDMTVGGAAAGRIEMTVSYPPAHAIITEFSREKIEKSPHVSRLKHRLL
jgi:hypothetical protein